MKQAASATRRIKLWDAPTRLFHWALVAAVSTALATGLTGGSWMELHGKAGLAIGGLLVFRLVWGFAGNRQARFASFLPTLSSLRAYLRGQWRGVGHNPLGALSVLALLSLLSLQLSTGVFGNDEIAFTGPLAAHVSESLSLWLTGWHHRFANVLYLLLGLHVAAIAFYRLVKKDDLVKPMVTGYKEVPNTQELDVSPPAAWWALPLALVLAVVAVLFLSGVLLPAEPPPAVAAPAAQTPAKPAW
jgi:cytochrome b